MYVSPDCEVCNHYDSCTNFVLNNNREVFGSYMKHNYMKAVAPMDHYIHRVRYVLDLGEVAGVLFCSA